MAVKKKCVKKVENRFYLFRQSDIWTLLAAAIKYSPQSKDDKKPKQSDQLTVKHEKEEKQNEASENNNLDGKESLMNLPGINELNITKDEQETGSQVRYILEIN